jgi:tripeptidyl-peptidase-1
MLTSALFTAVLAGLASASPLRVRSPYAVKETHPVPSHWTEIASAPANHMIQLQIGLKQSQFDELERHLYEGM